MTTISGLNFDDAQESMPLPKGKYDVQVTGAEIKATGPNSKRPGSPQVKVALAFTGPTLEEQNAMPVNHFIGLPHEDDDAGAARYKTLLLKRFLVAFNVPFQNGDLDLDELCYSLAGRTATVEVDLSEPDGNGNVYNSIILPRIPSEGSYGRR